MIFKRNDIIDKYPWSLKKIPLIVRSRLDIARDFVFLALPAWHFQGYPKNFHFQLDYLILLSFLERFLIQSPLQVNFRLLSMSCVIVLKSKSIKLSF